VAGFNIGCDISPDGMLVASGSAEGGVCFYDWNSTARQQILRTAHQGATTDVAFHPLLPRMVASSGWDGSIILHE